MERKLKEERKVGDVQAEGKEPHLLLHHPAPAVTCTHTSPANSGLGIPVITPETEPESFQTYLFPAQKTMDSTWRNI